MVMAAGLVMVFGHWKDVTMKSDKPMYKVLVDGHGSGFGPGFWSLVRLSPILKCSKFNESKN